MDILIYFGDHHLGVCDFAGLRRRRRRHFFDISLQKTSNNHSPPRPPSTLTSISFAEHTGAHKLRNPFVKMLIRVYHDYGGGSGKAGPGYQSRWLASYLLVYDESGG